MTDPTYEKFMEEICASPEDWELRLIFADYLEDHALEGSARAQRWMAQHKKRAYPGASSTGVHWYNVEQVLDRYYDPWSDLPRCVFALLEDGGLREGDWRYYETRRESEEDLMSAFSRVTSFLAEELRNA